MVCTIICSGFCSCSVEPCTPAETQNSKVDTAISSALLDATGLDHSDNNVQGRVKISEEEKRQFDGNVNHRLKLIMENLRKPN